MNRTDALILAAGQSSRMGFLKQLLLWEGETLLNRTIRIAGASGVKRIWVVLGAREASVRASLSHPPEISLKTVVNREFKSGMGSSIKEGMKAIMRDPNPPESLYLLLCDQPALTESHLEALRQKARSMKELLAASSYAGTCGPPLYLEAPLFELWARTPSAKGAKATLMRQKDHCVFLEWPEGALDLDTQEDLPPPPA